MKNQAIDEVEAFILTGDVGGTNTSLGLVHAENGRFNLVRKDGFQSRQLGNLDHALDNVLDDYKKLAGKKGIVGACFTIAGPVVDNRVSLTNLDWFIDGYQLADKLGFPVFLINDISGICYGLPLLDLDDPEHVLRLSHPDGTFPLASELRKGSSIQAVVAPGTGLGVGYLVKDRGNYLSLPAEAGHIDWGGFSEETRAMQTWLQNRSGCNPGVEEFLSGRGLENIARYFAETGHAGSPGQEFRLVLDSPPGDWGGKIAALYQKDPVCTRIMDLFVEILARYASSVALWMLPKGGLFLAGGIPGKNRNLILKNHAFMEAFLRNYQPGMREQLRQIPVYIALDYGINLQGAAHAFLCLSR